ncbi:MAG: hypothetical protein IJG94_08000 [Clostridia bacterium]|jgi:hypothetical protein|nr:hypothetical protein [Clostridia bacterium]
MKEAFYGMEYAEIRPERETDGFSGTLREMYERLGKAWCAETCAPRMRGDWTPENRTLGQCSVTAFLVQDYFGGTVYGIPLPEGGFHCYNVIGGQVFDLTDAQFGEKKLDYGGKNPEQFREVHFRDAEKQERYLRLKARFRDA